MKRISIILAVVLLLILAFTYLFIPNKITLSENIKIAANREALFRKLGDTTEWHKWWPEDKMGQSTTGKFRLNNLQYQPGGKNIISLPLSVSSRNFKFLTELIFIPLKIDSTVISLAGTITTSYNPIKRVQIYLTAKKFKKDLTTLLQSIKSYYSTNQALYGYDIQKKSVVDSTLVSTYKEVKGYPSTETIYLLIDELKNYIKLQTTNETGYPMLNIFKTDSINYRVKVAIPVDKKLAPSGNISYKRMLGGGKILVTEVHGGDSEVEKAFIQIQNYISDYQRIAPAIPFQSLVTDRRKEPDSTKWVTRIYYPVM